MAKNGRPSPKGLLTRQLRAQLWPRQQAAGRGLYYRGPTDFVLQHGEWFEPSPYDGEKGAPRACFGNAIGLAILRGYAYVEGWAIDPGLAQLAIHHAWNVTPDGKLADATWLNSGRAYLGVRFSQGRADDATWNGDASVLDDSNRGWPLLRDRWQGEDFERAWEPSEMLAAMLADDRDQVKLISERVRAGGG